jgi:Protein of unknown function (DUF1194)
MARRAFMAMLALGATMAVVPPAAAEPVALELVLAVDASVSVTDREFDLEVGGLARALRSEQVVQAIESTPGGIAVAVFQWGNVDEQRVLVDWIRVAGRRDAYALSARIAAMPRVFVGGATVIRNALDYAVGLFDDNGFEGERRIIDISADGRNNRGLSPAGARDRAVGRGITINGLAILSEEPFLDRYFETEVVGGAGAFVEPVTSYFGFLEALERKLIREIVGEPNA